MSLGLKNSCFNSIFHHQEIFKNLRENEKQEIYFFAKATKFEKWTKTSFSEVKFGVYSIRQAFHRMALETIFFLKNKEIN